MKKKRGKLKNMSPEQRAAFVNSQVSMMQAEMQVMLAENRERGENNLAPAYGSEQWENFKDSWANTLGHNAVIEFFNE